MNKIIIISLLVLIINVFSWKVVNNKTIEEIKKIIPIAINGIPGVLDSIDSMIDTYICKNVYDKDTFDKISNEDVEEMIDNVDLKLISNITKSKLNYDKLKLYWKYSRYLLYVAKFNFYNIYNDSVITKIINCLETEYINDNYIYSCAYKNFKPIKLI